MQLKVNTQQAMPHCRDTMVIDEPCGLFEQHLHKVHWNDTPSSRVQRVHAWQLCLLLDMVMSPLAVLLQVLLCQYRVAEALEMLQHLLADVLGSRLMHEGHAGPPPSSLVSGSSVKHKQCAHVVHVCIA